MEITKTVKKVLQSINGRANKYKEFGISRYEYSKFGISENTLRKIIEQLRTEGFLKQIRVDIFYVLSGKRRVNIYKATQKLLDIIKTFTTKTKKVIKDLNTKIFEWCYHDPINKMKSIGIKIDNNGRIGDKCDKVTINKTSGAITNWKTGEKWNIFNYLKEKTNMSPISFYLKYVGN